MLRQRIITAIVGIPLLAASVWFGYPWFTAVIVIAAGFATWEFYSMAKASKREPLVWFGMVWGTLFVISPHLPGANTLALLMSATVVLPLIWLLIRRSRETAFSNYAWTIIGIFYVGWLLSYWVNLRLLPDGLAWTFWGLAVAFSSDSGAYFVGRWKGKHKMAPYISPKKTWEGAAGGLFWAVVASVIVSFIFPGLGIGWGGVLLGLVGSIVAQVGDMIASLLKRNLGVKDSGPKFLPGHGGFIDRLSSLTFVGVFLYYGVLGHLGRLF